MDHIRYQTLTHNSESILCSYSPQPVSHLQCGQVCYFSFNNVLPLAPKFVFFTHASSFFNTHLYSFENLPSFHGLTQGLSFHSQHKFSHQLYQFHNTVSIHPSMSLLSLSAYGYITTNSYLIMSPS